MADRYWVGGTNSWDGTAGTKWASTSGGAGGASVPTSADDVFFDAASTGTCTISTGNTGAKSINCTGFAGTLTGTAAISVFGSVTLVAGMTFTYTGTLTLSGTGSITSAGKTFGNVILSGSGITVTLADPMTLGASNTFELSFGTLALAGFTLSTGIFSASGLSTRSISFGSGNIALTSTTAATTVLSMATATNFTWTGTGGFTRNQAATATISFGSSSGGTASNAPNLTVNAGASTLTLTTASWFKNLDFTGSTCPVDSVSSVNITENLTLSSGGTYTSLFLSFRGTGTITSAGKTLGGATINAATHTVTLADAMTLSASTTFFLTAGTFDLNNFNLSTGVFSSSGTSTRAISFGSGNISLTSTTNSTTVLAMTNVTGFSWTGTGGFTRNQAATATVSLGSSTGGVASRAMNLKVNAGSSTLTITANSYFKDVDFTGSTCTVTASNLNMAGNLTLASGGTYTSLTPTFVASGTITSAGKTLGVTTINGSGITVTLADSLTASNLYLTQGGFDASGFNVTVGLFSSSNTNTRTLNMGSGTWVISGSGSTAWNTSTTTGLTIIPGTSTITMISASAKIFAGGGLTYHNLNQGGAGALTISGSNTFNNITNSVQPATVTFTAGTTQTVSAFGLSGTVGNLITINSTASGSQFTLSSPSGSINAQYLSIKDSNATGGANWVAINSINDGNNSGWVFSSNGAFMQFF